MVTRQERQQLEAQWSSEDRAIAGYARLLKTAVLVIVMIGLLWIGGTGELTENSHQAGNVGAPAVTKAEGSAVSASRRALGERRAPELASQHATLR